MWVRRLSRVFAVLLVGLTLDATPAVAQTRPAPQATQHALDELANYTVLRLADLRSKRLGRIRDLVQVQRHG